MNEKQASVAARISDLSCLPMAELWTLWDRYFTRRPAYPNRTHVESRVAYKLQEDAFGGLAVTTRQRLGPLARSIPRSSSVPSPASSTLRRARCCCANGASGNTKSRCLPLASLNTRAAPSRG